MGERCIPCAKKNDLKRTSEFRFLENQLLWAGKHYHKYDNAFVAPPDDEVKVYEIVQILDIRPGGKVRVRWYAPQSQIPDVGRSDSVRLFLTIPESYDRQRAVYL